MTDKQTLLAEIEKFLSKTGMSASTFGHKTANDGKLLARLRKGHTVTLETAGAITAFIHERTSEQSKRKRARAAA